MCRFRRRPVAVRLFFLGAFIALCTADACSGQSANKAFLDEVSYTNDIRPIVNNFCKTCHTGDNPEGEFVLASYEDVRKHTDKIYALLEIDSDTHAPPICKFHWGKFTFRCILESVSGKFTLFIEDGTPVRATLSVTFKEFVDVKVEVRKTPLQSADHFKTFIVKQGDSLSSIAAAEYEDPSMWRMIARKNSIVNPRVLKPGRRLVIPPLD